MTPYHESDGVVLYHGDCREILPQLGRFDLLLTDPPYGIGADRGMGGGGYDGFGDGRKRTPKRYRGDWDANAPDAEVFSIAIAVSNLQIIWGGNYFTDMLPQNGKWLIWDKMQTMPTYSDAELAWTSLNGVSVKMFRYNGSGLMAEEKHRVHPTQKPLALMRWCLQFAPNAKTILDPFAGSGTTLLAAKLEGRKAVGIEISEEYCEIAANRLRQRLLF